VDWYYQSESRVQPLADPLHMLVDILKIHRNWRAGLYAEHASQSDAQRAAGQGRQAQG
jgi:dolichyl-phosphate beta-glucosyltransferase